MACVQIAYVVRHERVGHGRFGRGHVRPTIGAIHGRVRGDHRRQVPKVQTPLSGLALGEPKKFARSRCASRSQAHPHGAQGSRVRDARHRLATLPIAVSLRGFRAGTFRAFSSIPCLLVRRVGYHAYPSMNRLHLHVMSNDFCGYHMKQPYQWNSFHTEFFVSTNSKYIIYLQHPSATVPPMINACFFLPFSLR